jgi:hypothetical protein
MATDDWLWGGGGEEALLAGCVDMGDIVDSVPGKAEHGVGTL